MLKHEPRSKLKFISPSLSWLLPSIICENRSHSLWSKCLSSCGDCSRNWSNAINSPKPCQTKDKAETFPFLTEWHYSGTGSKSWNFFKGKESQHTVVSIIEQSLSMVMLVIFYRIDNKVLQIVETSKISCIHYERHTKWKKPTVTHWKNCWFCKNHLIIFIVL